MIVHYDANKVEFKEEVGVWLHENEMNPIQNTEGTFTFSFLNHFEQKSQMFWPDFTLAYI